MTKERFLAVPDLYGGQ